MSLKAGDSILGIPGYSPQEYIPSQEEQQNAVVIISVGKVDYHAEIIDLLTQMGFKNIVLMKDIYEINNPFRLPEALQSQGFEYYLEQKAKIFKAYELFTDDESRDVFLAVLQTHMQRIPVVIPARPRDEQYFPPDIKLAKGYSRFVNCGAYDGDTIRLLNQVHGIVDEIVCFETEPQLFDRLTHYLREKKEHLARNTVTAIPCAVYSQTLLHPFISGGGLGSRVAENGDVQKQCVALDDVIPGFQPTFINMDIEGAELDALQGAVQILKLNTPDLGISLYHTPNHLWDIPLFLNELDMGYHFYLRNYTSFTTETILYASSGQS